jgi:putative membrane protein
MKFLIRYSTKAILYYLILLGAWAIGLLPGTALTALWAALMLALVNMVLRPIFVIIALPFNIITLGIASVFANLLSLVIANAIIGGPITAGFWAMLLVALVIMLADDCARAARAAIKSRRIAS